MPRSRPRAGLVAALAAIAITTAACADDDPEEDAVPTPTTTAGAPTGSADPTGPTAPPVADADDARRGPVVEDVAVAGTTLHVERRGDGPPLLLVHGAGEDAAALAPQAADLAAVGWSVITYDRRGTGASGRDDWPGSGAPQHADDAAALLAALDVGPATVLGVSSGGVVALELAARHPDAVERVIAWEPPAAGVIPGGADLTAQLMAPVEAHLVEHPGDYVGAQAILLEFLVGAPVSIDDPAFAAARAHAEPMVRDDPTITLATFTAADLADRDVTLAIGSEPNDVVAAAVAGLAELTGEEPVAVTGFHEIYVVDPTVLTGVVGPPR